LTRSALLERLLSADRERISVMSRSRDKRKELTNPPRNPRKRRKLEDISDERPHVKGSTGVSVPTLLSADELVWKEITPPERLEDAEGFLELEEIDNVEVIRDAAGKHARFRVRTGPPLWYDTSNGPIE
jgi:hypothetical protein